MSYWSFDHQVSEDDVLHYGVLGMKWGVRQYQNYDGTRTRKGLERYKSAEEDRKKANQKYKDTKTAYKSGKATKAELSKTRIESKKENKKTKILYKDLARAKLADEGAKLYQEGRRINENKTLSAIQAATITAGSMALAKWLSMSGNKKISNIPSSAVLYGGTVVNMLLQNKNALQNKKLRAYYSYRPAKV